MRSAATDSTPLGLLYVGAVTSILSSTFATFTTLRTRLDASLRHRTLQHCPTQHSRHCIHAGDSPARPAYISAQGFIARWCQVACQHERQALCSPSLLLLLIQPATGRTGVDWW